MSLPPLLLIIDHAPSRAADVARIARYARERHGVGSLLVRACPEAPAPSPCDAVIGVDPRAPDFVDRALAALEPYRGRLRGGLVFSDPAVHAGSMLLERLGLRTDPADPALRAVDRYAYRMAERAHGQLLSFQKVMVPRCARIGSATELQAFSDSHADGFVVKPRHAGGYRGAVTVSPGDNLQAMFHAVSPHFGDGMVGEQRIPYRREYSFDGVGATAFLAEKLMAPGRHAVEIARVLPARLSALERHTLQRTGLLCNLLTGQRDGPFHHGIRLGDDGQGSAVVAAHRRPAGMKTWSLAEAVYGVDLYARWVDSALGVPVALAVPEPSCQAATVLLGVARDGVFSPSGLDGWRLLEQALALTAAAHGIAPGALRAGEFGWRVGESRFLHGTPRSAADFAAQATITLDDLDADLRPVIATLRERWTAALSVHPTLETLQVPDPTGPAMEAVH
ncbi:biotin carboxylase [Paracidovorax anthurii]|uniref:ATP-grasp domain-containing protein n=1 Tax=Paracidovorax anthurii TaxID=78229 RepID=A0A328YYQ1_9BURK|nr:biotin carboxylase [Paracidovorax anthurii]RAR78869.1 hypothetical protein AX018_102812 [Paracidovorax anthurii]